jgi:hypothetical protein
VENEEFTPLIDLSDMSITEIMNGTVVGDNELLNRLIRNIKEDEGALSAFQSSLG